MINGLFHLTSRNIVEGIFSNQGSLNDLFQVQKSQKKHSHHEILRKSAGGFRVAEISDFVASGS